MNVMEIVSGAGIDGAVMHCLLLARELGRRGHAVTLVCRPGAWIRQQLTDAPIEVVESDLSRWPPGELRRIASIARQRRIDVVHTHMSRAHFFGVLLRAWGGLPCVATAHSRHFQLHWRLNDRVIAVSAATAHYHRRRNLVSARRLAVIHNFVDPERFAAPNGEGGAAARQALAIANGTPLIGAMGAIIPQKGVGCLIEALARVRMSVPNARLLILGSGPPAHLAGLGAMVRRLGLEDAVIFAGLRNDVPELLSAMDVFVSASLEENLPLSILEAMAAGLPVVASAVGGVPECVSADTGLLVRAADSTALADAIATLLRDPTRRRELGTAARRRVRERFSPDTQVPRIEALLASAAARRTPA